MATTNYHLPLFTATGTVDLIGVYNEAITRIDNILSDAEKQVNTNSINIADLKKVAFTTSSSDTILTVSQLAGAKVTKNGIVYYVSTSA